VVNDQGMPDLLDRARQACARAVAVVGEVGTTLERAKATRTPSEALAHSRLVELNELVDNLNQRLESQPVIEQAKGVLMARSHCSPDEAFEMLRRASMRMNRKLREVAADIVHATVAQAEPHHG
jgi:AmiR/NasT family two-component response regulator